VSHVALMVAYALMVSSFFALLWRRDRSKQLKLFLQIFLSMIVGGIALAWLMFPFPSGPPAPFP
jgi:hypothetical protein